MLKIASYRIPELQKRIDSFNRKAEKFGLPPVGFTVVREFTEKRKTEAGETYYLEFSEVEINGEAPKLNGWALHSRVEPTGITGMNNVYTAPGFGSVERLRYTSMACEHCNADRGRKLVYLLQNQETGEQKLVGRTCITDFIQADAEGLLRHLEGLRALSAGDGEEDSGNNAPRQEYVYPVDLALAEALVLIGKFGYVSRKAADAYNEKVYGSADDAESVDVRKLKTPTSYDMARQDQPATKYGPGFKRDSLYTASEIEAQAGNVEAVKSYIQAQDNTGNDFIYNLQVYCKLGYIKPRYLGYLAAAANMWIKSQEETAAKNEAPAKSNEWLGSVGTRQVFANLKLVRESSVAGFTYGTFTYILGFEDEAGNSVVWFSSNRAPCAVGEVVSLKATVKKHEDYKGRKQTVITRGAVV